MRLSQELIIAATARKDLPRWDQMTKSVAEGHSRRSRQEAEPGAHIYGFTTLPGHREGDSLDPRALENYWMEVVDAHAIGQGPYYSDELARCITVAKISNIATGYLGLGVETFSKVRSALVDSRFSPSVPRGASYSCGDVIPGAHWVKGFTSYLRSVDGRVQMAPGDVMALMNGNYVHLGLALGALPAAQTVWNLNLIAIALSSSASSARASDFFFWATSEGRKTTEALRHVEQLAHGALRSSGVQDPVSLRAAPQVIEVLATALDSLLNSLDSVLLRPSGNPLFPPDSGAPLSQASFMSPALTVVESSLIEAALLVGWAAHSRLTYVLGGHAPLVPKDGVFDSARPLGLIQLPKLVLARLETVRSYAGRRAFASGGTASSGLEDLWSHGTNTTGLLHDVLAEVALILAVEAVASAWCCSKVGVAQPASDWVLEKVVGVDEREALELGRRLVRAVSDDPEFGRSDLFWA